MKTSEVLDASADEVLKGWCQWASGDYDRPTGNVCALGAIDRVTGGYLNGHGGLYYNAVLALSRIVLHCQNVYHWNDTAGRTAGEVADAMRTAAKVLRERGE